MRCCLSARCPENLFLMNKWLKGLSASKHPKHKLHYHRMSQKQANPQHCWEHWAPSLRCSRLSCSLSGSCWAVSHGQAVLWPRIHHRYLALPLPCTPGQGWLFPCSCACPCFCPRQLRNMVWASCSYPGCPSFELVARTSTDREWEWDRVLSVLYFCAMLHNIRF